LALVGALFVTPAHAAPSALGAADTILYGGTIITMDKLIPSAEAIAIAGGTIMAVGSTAEVMRLRGKSTEVVNLQGRTVLPGFIDSHSHIIGDRTLANPPYPTVPAAARAALSMGWTGVSEMFVNQARMDELRYFDQRGQLGLRVNAYLPVNYLDQHFGIWFTKYSPGAFVSDRVRLAGAKLSVDQTSPDLMYLSEPHLDNPGYLGEVYWTQVELTDMVTTLHTQGWQVAAHTVGDGAHDMVLDAIETALHGASNLEHRHRIEHALVIRDDQIARMERLGIYASFQLNWFDSDWVNDPWWANLEATLGPMRIGWVTRWRDLLDASVPSIGSTDTPWSPATPMQAVYLAVTRIGPTGTPPRPWMLEQRLSVDEALRLLTIGAAWGTHEEHLRGSLTTGKLADVVVLSHNPLSTPVSRIPAISVMMTMVDGRIWHCPAPCFGLRGF
jgi:predicted amidohydrolase YtcJ